ncbi:hypothetical protein M409DRAFT_65185 [Zasmidium cellare ATCC 36951]|uniref:FAD/NAD(P)-binding domain-containing protein n=1 Tax=Zasmidium cellare ATCC 36951 TaxID=1080233 RepID=A0A6A6CRH7_ZASCE|nr:uncharacterized protein M409DRAFT_65185 [Zasmidium cellare ATCC 36951]KAF2168778.1 hypothetical protein M409DRAFT_65185 [Zasmidium cellare ATCC 36951]
MAVQAKNRNITPAVGFDDIPGQLPEGTIPEDVDYNFVAEDAIEQLNNIRPDNFTNNAIWRDLLALTHTLRTFNSKDSVYSTFQALCQEKRVSRIWMLRTWLESFQGHGHPDEAQAGITSQKDDILGAAIIGGGQAGLAVAGRLQALGVSYIVFEKNARVGDIWRKRYDSLRVHTPREYGPLPLGWRFPGEEDIMLPAKRMGDGHEAWAEEHAVNIQTGTEVIEARCKEIESVWTIRTKSVHGENIFKAKNLVLAIGPGLTQPVSPFWASPSNIAASGFKGDIFHASGWKSAKPWFGKRGIVIGVANTGHDIGEDMANAGMDTTMVQRGPTFVLPVEWLHAAFAPDYNLDKETKIADQEQVTIPNKIARNMTNMMVQGLIKTHSARFDALEDVGFKVDREGDLFSCLFERFGGHYIDHGGSARIAKGDIKVQSKPVKGLYAEGLEFEDGSRIPADLIVLATGFSHDFRAQAGKIIGTEAAGKMDEFGGLDKEGEMRGFARPSGHPNLYYHGFEVRASRYCSRFIGLAIQADVLGRPLKPYLN